MPKGQQNKVVSVEFDSVTDKALRGAMNDPLSVEAESTARIIAALKRASKSKPIVVIDANASLAKLVARRLAALGFRSVHVVERGFDGWLSAGLATTSAGRGGALPLLGTTVMAKR